MASPNNGTVVSTAPSTPGVVSTPTSTVLVSSSPLTSVQISTATPTPVGTTTLIGSSSPTGTAVQTLLSTVTAANPSPSASNVIETITSVTSLAPSPTTPRTSQASSATASSSSAASSLVSNGSSSSGGGGLSSGATVAIAVVVPVVCVAAIVVAAIFWWRKRKQKKVAQEARRKEVEEYGYNPNEDPTLPAVAAGGSDSPEMSEDTSGYRGWGNNANAASTGRKASTNLSSGGIGMAVSDDGRHNSPGFQAASDGGHSGEPLVDGHSGAEAAGMTGAGLAGGAATQRGTGLENGVQRGPSNASSTYSAAGNTENSDDFAGADHGYDTNYSQYTPYRPNATQYDDASQPVIRDVTARRNTKIENPSVLPKQGNSGIAQNF